MLNYVKLNDLLFSCSNNCEEIKLVGKSEDTCIKYTVNSNLRKSELYYDLITVYNEKEKWYRNIPVPIFIKAFLPYCGDETLLDILETYEDIKEAMEDKEQFDKYFWNRQMCLVDIPFMLRFVYSIAGPDLDLNQSYMLKDTLEELKMNISSEKLKLKYFLPVMRAVGFEFEKDTEDDSCLNGYYLHSMDRVLSGNIVYDEQGNISKKLNAIDVRKEAEEDLYSDPVGWGRHGYLSYKADNSTYNKGIDYFYRQLPSIQDYLSELLESFNPNNFEDESNYNRHIYNADEKDLQYVIRRGVIDREALTKDSEFPEYVPVKYVEVKWTSDMYRDIKELFDKCLKGYEQVQEPVQEYDIAIPVIVSQLVALAENNENLNKFRTNLMLDLTSDNKKNMLKYLNVLDYKPRDVLATVREFLESLNVRDDISTTDNLSSLCSVKRI